MDPFVGEIRCFSFNQVPTGWLQCSGQTLQVNQYQALYSLIGTQFGGNGSTTFNLPNLNGVTPLHYNAGAQVNVGTAGGAETVKVVASQMPAHTHLVEASNVVSNEDVPTAYYLGATASPHLAYGPSASPVAMAADIVGNAGSNAAHPNLQPYLALSFCIATTGLYPSRP
jgi:microcystin-dependent protein